MNSEKYQTMVKAVAEGASERFERDLELVMMAMECDRLRDSLAENGRHLERLWREFSEKVERGITADPPRTAGLEVIEHGGAFQARVASLISAIRMVYGSEGVKKFREAGAER